MISDPLFGMFDQEMVLSYQIPGFGFTEVFGCKQDDQRFETDVTFADGRSISGNHQKELYKEVTADALVSYADGSPAILSNRYGNGRAVLCGVNLGLCHSQKSLIADDLKSNDKGNDSPVAKEIILDICKQAGVTQNLCTAPGVKYSYLTAEAGTAVILINSTGQPATGSIPLLSNDFAKATSIYNQANATLENGNLCFALEPDQCAVVRLER